MIYGYCRVSSKSQALYGSSLDSQQQAILAKYPTAKITIEAYSGYKDTRPLFDELIKSLRKGDILVVTKLDRFCRSASNGINTLHYLYKVGVSFDILNMGVVENTAMGNLLFSVLQSFAQFERDMIVERTTAGKEIAKLKPDYHEGRTKIIVKDFSEKYAQKQKGFISVREAIASLGISKSKWYRLIEDTKGVQNGKKISI